MGVTEGVRAWLAVPEDVTLGVRVDEGVPEREVRVELGVKACVEVSVILGVIVPDGVRAPLALPDEVCFCESEADMLALAVWL